MIILGSLESAYGLSISADWTFLQRRYERLSVQNRLFRSNGGRLTKNFKYKGSPHQPFFFSENSAKWSFVWYKNLDRFFFIFVTIHAFDRRTDGRTELIPIARPLLHFMQCGKKTFGRSRLSPAPRWGSLQHSQELLAGREGLVPLPKNPSLPTPLGVQTLIYGPLGLTYDHGHIGPSK